MANEYALSHQYPSYAAPRDLWAPLVFLFLLLLVFVGLDAFSPPPLVSQFGGAPVVSKTDALRQVAYVSAGFLIGIVALQRLGLAIFKAVPASMALLLVWCLGSALWAPESSIVIRRAGMEIIVVVSLMLGTAALGPERAFTLWRWLLAFILLINFASIPLIPTARHAAGEIDPQLVGNWRGLYGHKNIAGAVCAMTIILFLFTRTGWKNWIGIAISAAAGIFLFFTHSKSSAGFLPVALFAGLMYRIGWRDGLSRAIVSTLAALFLCGGLAFLLLYADKLSQMLSDPTEFTGRSAIWAAEFRYIADHPLLGAGFGTFTDTKSQSPLHNYVTGWVGAVSHGHNGYLQVLVTIGGIGFALLALAVIVMPLVRLWRLDWSDNAFRPMLLALFVFALLHNVMESDFLEGDGVTWSGLLLVVAALNAQRYSLTRR